MSIISVCPLCSEMVTIPKSLDIAAWVRCPLCGAAYPLGKAMDMVPPELIPVEAPDEEISIRPHNDEVGSDEIESVAATTLSVDSPIEPPPIHNASLESTSLTADESSAEPLDEEVFSIIAEHKVKTGNNIYNQIDQLDSEGRSRRKSKNPVHIFIGIIIGGFLGISIAYIAMAWIMGSRFDLPSPPRVLKPVLQYVLPERIWADKEQQRKNP
jgi:hypothetical protein